MTYAATVLALSPIAYWRLGEASGTSAADASGNGHTGTYVGSPTLGVAGLLTGDANTAVTFGSGKYVTTVASTGYDVAHPAIVAWLKGSAFTNLARIASQANGTGSNHWFFNVLSTGKVQFTYHAGTGTNLVADSGTTLVDDNVRHMVVARFDGSFIDIFVDGVRVTHFTASAVMQLTAGIPVYIGNDVGGGFTGAPTLDEVAYFDAANLTDAAIASLWTDGTTAGNLAAGSLTLGGTVGGSARPGASGALTLGGSTVAPVITRGSLTLGSPTAEARPVYLASFTVDVGQEASDIPDVAPVAPTVDYTGDDDSDLVDYPDPTLDEWGRPIAS